MKETEIERLFRQYYNRMVRLARTMLYDDEESRDVVSEVFATLVKTDITPKNVESYLVMSIRNRCLNLLEHKEVRAKFEQAYTMEARLLSSDDDEGLSTVSVEKEYEQLMDYARRQLTEQALMVFQMRHLQGMKYQEIAKQLGISRVMVYKHLAKAMTTIKEYQKKIR